MSIISEGSKIKPFALKILSFKYKKISGKTSVLSDIISAFQTPLSEVFFPHFQTRLT
jgi:hypothetical protein